MSLLLDRFHYDTNPIDDYLLTTSQLLTKLTMLTIGLPTKLTILTTRTT